MWIQLTDCHGQTVSLNSSQLVMVKKHGDQTLIVHARGEILVLQSHDAVIKALGLHGAKLTDATREQRIELH